MEMNNLNHMEIPSVAVPLVSRYEDSEHYQSQYNPLDYMRPTHYCGTDPNYPAHVSTPFAMSGSSIMPRGLEISCIEQPPSYDNLIPYEESSYYRAGPAINHPNGSVHLCHQSNNHGDGIFYGYQYPEYSTFHHPDVAYPYSYHSSQANVNMPFQDSSRYIHKMGCDCALCHGGNIQATYPETYLSQSNMYPIGVENSRCNYDAPYKGLDKSNSDLKPIGWEREKNRLVCDGNVESNYAPKPIGGLSQSNIYPIGVENSRYNYDASHRGFYKSDSVIKPIGSERVGNKLAFEENIRSYDRDLPSEENSFNQEYEYENRYDSESTKTWEVASLSRALESASNTIESGEDGETQCDEITLPDTKPASSVETENHNESTPKKVTKEKKKKAKPSLSREKRSKKHSTPIFHVKWEGVIQPEYETAGQVCQLCEEELSIPQEHAYGDFEYYGLNDQPQNYQEVSVLPCGHVFHTSCLDHAAPEELLQDPICFLCLSCES